MKKYRIAAVLLAAALAVTLAGESALGVPPQGKGKAPAQGQAGLAKAGQGAANGQGAQKGQKGGKGG